eukprot:GHVR01071222.1.p2 GENE.GHVR01071222.1~~GHVR01071222.1.p2  ORF type:complete len:109 (+),score=3.27 GHVR01071222.1:513-839(+)
MVCTMNFASRNDAKSIQGPGFLLGIPLEMVTEPTIPHARQIKAVIRTAQAKPTVLNRRCSKSGNTTPPTPAPDSTIPIAVALYLMKCVAVALTQGKNNRPDPIPKSKP